MDDKSERIVVPESRGERCSPSQVKPAGGPTSEQTQLCDRSRHLTSEASESPMLLLGAEEQSDLKPQGSNTPKKHCIVLLTAKLSFSNNNQLFDALILTRCPIIKFWYELPRVSADPQVKGPVPPKQPYFTHHLSGQLPSYL